MRRVSPLRTSDPVRLGAYRIEGRIGTGGQGVVYLGRGHADQPVAIKSLHADFTTDPQAAARFGKEIAAARKVAAFCTAQVLDADGNAEQPYIVSEYIDGPSLQQSVAENGPRTGSALHRLAIATATALAAIHEAGVVHRDFKPHNVLLGPDGPRVIDFGIAYALGTTATATNRVLGTPAYMAPEQVAGQRVGPPADVFAWAGVMVFAATGRPPFGNDSIPAIVARIAHAEPVLDDGLASPLRELLTECFAKDPGRRPSARDVLDRLLGAPRASYAEVPDTAAGTGDAVPPDAAPPDAVPPDAVPPDAVPPDAVPSDAVPPDAADTEPVAAGPAAPAGPGPRDRRRGGVAGEMARLTAQVAGFRRRRRRWIWAIGLLALVVALTDVFGSEPALNADAPNIPDRAMIEAGPDGTQINIPRDGPGIPMIVTFTNDEWYPVTVTGISPSPNSGLRVQTRHLPTGQADLSRAVDVKPLTVRPYGSVSYVVRVWAPPCPDGTIGYDLSGIVRVNTRVFGLPKQVRLQIPAEEQLAWRPCS